MNLSESKSSKAWGKEMNKKENDRKKGGVKMEKKREQRKR